METAFAIVHEVMHVMTLDGKKMNKTNSILSETTPTLAETLLGDFILKNHEKFELNDSDLRYDINLYKVSKHVSAINNVDTELNKKVNIALLQHCSPDVIASQLRVNPTYFFAQIINDQFEKYTYEDKENKLQEFINFLKHDEFVECLDVNLNKNSKDEYLSYMNEMINKFEIQFENLEILNENHIIESTHIKELNLSQIAKKDNVIMEKENVQDAICELSKTPELEKENSQKLE